MKAVQHKGLGTMRVSFRDRYLEASTYLLASQCPIEAGLLGNYTDNECKHGRLPGDGSAACGCFTLTQEVKGA